MRIALLAGLLITIWGHSAHADPALPVTIRWTGAASGAPAITVFASGPRTIDFALVNGTAAVDLATYTPVCWWSTNANQGSQVIPASCSILVATAGTFRATFSASDLNHAAGNYVYGVGLTDSGYTTAQQGGFIIRSDPYASGGVSISFTNAYAGQLAALTARVAAMEASTNAWNSGITNTPTLAQVLVKGNNAGGAAITNVYSLHVDSIWPQVGGPVSLVNAANRQLWYEDGAPGPLLTSEVAFSNSVKTLLGL